MLLRDVFLQDAGHFLNGFLEGKWSFEVFLDVYGLLLNPEGVLVLNLLTLLVFFHLGVIFFPDLGDAIDVVVFYCAVLHLAIADPDLNVLGRIGLLGLDYFLNNVHWLFLICRD